jgi:hypothetical protein
MRRGNCVTVFHAQNCHKTQVLKAAELARGASADEKKMLKRSGGVENLEVRLRLRDSQKLDRRFLEQVFHGVPVVWLEVEGSEPTHGTHHSVHPITLICRLPVATSSKDREAKRYVVWSITELRITEHNFRQQVVFERL